MNLKQRNKVKLIHEEKTNLLLIGMNESNVLVWKGLLLRVGMKALLVT